MLSPWTFLSALLVVLSFPPWNLTHLIWFALVPWFLAIDRTRTKKQAAVQGLWMAMLMSLGGFYWVAFVLREFAGIPWILAIFGLLLFCLICEPQFIAMALLLKIKTKKHTPLYHSIAIALAYAALDWVIPKLFVDTLGNAFYNSRVFRQAADLGGATLLTFAIVFVNYTLWVIIREIKNRKGPSLRPCFSALKLQTSLALAVVLALALYGETRDAEIKKIIAQSGIKIQAGVIQANIGDFDKLASERGVRGAANKVLETFFRLSDQALAMTPRPDFLVWPETSYPSTFRNPLTPEELARDQQLEKFVADRNIPVLFGGYDHANQKDFNAFFFLSPQQSAQSAKGENQLLVYRKNILLAFGEYIPFTENIKLVRDWFPQVGYFGRGLGPDALNLSTPNPLIPHLKINPIICYEALFPSYVIEGARKGSQLILNITNDSWFGPYAEPELHLALTTFRGIETRLPQLRATNTGISALITADGEITQSTHVDRSEILNVAVTLTPEIPTLMKAWGDWFGLFALVCSVLIFLIQYPFQTRTQAKLNTVV